MLELQKNLQQMKKYISSVHYSEDGKIFMQLDGKASEAAEQAISLRAGTSGYMVSAKSR